MNYQNELNNQVKLSSAQIEVYEKIREFPGIKDNQLHKALGQLKSRVRQVAQSLLWAGMLVPCRGGYAVKYV